MPTHNGVWRKYVQSKPATRLKYWEPPDAALVLDYAEGYIRRGWCQHASAMTRDGTACSAVDPDARRWCLLGAIDAGLTEYLGSRPGGTNAWDDTARFVHRALGEVTGVQTYSLAHFNDFRARSKEDVLEVIKRAKQLAANA